MPMDAVGTDHRRHTSGDEPADGPPGRPTGRLGEPAWPAMPRLFRDAGASSCDGCRAEKPAGPPVGLVHSWCGRNEGLEPSLPGRRSRWAPVPLHQRERCSRDPWDARSLGGTGPRANPPFGAVMVAYPPAAESASSLARRAGMGRGGGIRRHGAGGDPRRRWSSFATSAGNVKASHWQPVASSDGHAVRLSVAGESSGGNDHRPSEHVGSNGGTSDVARER
jgi:hypothetical protein